MNTFNAIQISIDITQRVSHVDSVEFSIKVCSHSMFNGLQMITISMGIFAASVHFIHKYFVCCVILITQISLVRVKTRHYFVSLPIVCHWSIVISYEY